MAGPKKNTAYVFCVSLGSQASRPQFQANPTLAAGDVKVSTDEGAFANLATLPTVSPASGRNVKVSLSAAEMNGDRIVVQFVDAAGAEWDELVIVIETESATITDLDGRIPTALGANGNIKADVRDFNGTAGTFASGRPEINVSHWLGTAASAPTVAGVPNVNVKTWNDLTTVALPLIPTVAGRTLDVSATGEAGVDWANVGTPGSTVNLAATTVNLANTVTTLTNLPAITAGWLTAAGIADGAIDRATFAVDTGLQTIRSGTAQGGGAGSITLDASASAVNDLYNGLWVLLTGGTSAGQCRLISDYDGTTKIATVVPDWVNTAPDATSTFAILPASDVRGLNGNTPPSGWSSLSIASGRVAADAQAISGDTTAADNLELFFDGTGYNAANSTVGTVTLVTTLTTYTGNTVQTGDSFARLGAPAGASIAADLVVIDNFVDDLESRLTALRAGYLDNLSAGAVATAAALTTVQSDTDDIQTRLPAALVGGRMDSSVGAVATGAIVAASFGAGAIDAAALATDAANEIADALLDRTAGVETGLTPRQCLRLIVSACAGKMSGGGTGTEVFRNAVADSANRISATVDASGNRSAITYVLT